MKDPTKRFSDRVENYLKYRPRYPSGILDILKAKCGLASEHVVADIGSGTGFLAELREVFVRHQQSGAVTFSYDTKAYIGRLES